MPISSCNSRISVCSGRSPGSTLPPGNSHSPASALPSGRWAISTRLSLSTSAQATTRVSFMAVMQWWRAYDSRERGEGVSRPVIAVDRDIFLGEVAGQYAVAALAQPERDPDLDFWILHRRGNLGFVIGRIAR